MKSDQITNPEKTGNPEKIGNPEKTGNSEKTGTSLMRKIRVLMICPYPGMKELVETLTAEFPSLAVECLYTELDSLLLNVESKCRITDFDFVIARGLATELLSQRLTVPIIDIPILDVDILQTCQSVREHQGIIALVIYGGFSDRDYVRAEEFLQEICFYRTREEAELLIRDLEKKKITLVVGDTYASDCAKRAGLASVLVTAGRESLCIALRQAQLMGRGLGILRDEHSVFRGLALRDHSYVLVYDGEGRLIISTLHDNGECPALRRFVEEHLSELTGERDEPLHCSVRGFVWYISGSMQEGEDGAEHLTITIDRGLSTTWARSREIAIREPSDFTGEWQYEYESNQITGSLAAQIRTAARNSGPVLILGESGTEKELIAYSIYTGSSYRDAPLYTINFEFLSKRDWEWLVNAPSSPVSQSNVMLLFFSSRLMTEEQWSHIEQLILYSNLAKRNKLVFCYTSGRSADRSGIVSFFMRASNGQIVYAPSVREKSDTIPDMIMMHVSNYNALNGRYLAGFDEGALKLLMSYDWPGNFTQMKRVLNELLGSAHTLYIEEDQVRECLEKERRFFGNVMSRQEGIRVRTEQTMQEIMMDVVRQVMAEERNNKKRVAERLGISRTTLWRLLSGEEERKK